MVIAKMTASEQIVSMAISIDLERLKRGLKARFSKISSKSSSRKSSDLLRDSVFDIFESKLPSVALQNNERAVARWLVINALTRANSVKEQIETAISLSDPQDIYCVISYGIGHIFAEKAAVAGDFENTSDEDYSIIIESAIRAKLLVNDPLEPLALNEIRGALAKLSRRVARSSASPFQAITGKLGAVMRRAGVADIGAFREYLAQMKQNVVHIIGADILTSLQALTDPTQKISSDKLEQIFDLLKDWQLSDVGFSLLCFRVLGDFPSEKIFLNHEKNNVGQNFSNNAKLFINLLLSDEYSSSEMGFVPVSYEERVLSNLINIGRSIKYNDPEEMHKGIVNLFSIDPILVEFLPWEKILFVMEDQGSISLEAIFTTMLMCSKPIQKISRRVAIRVGNGAFIGDLTSFAQAEQKSDLTNFLQRLQPLPSRVSAELAKSILEPAIFERFIGATAARTSRVDGVAPLSGVNKRLLRIETIINALKSGLINKEYAKKEIDSENEQARLQFFEHKMRLGRVRIPLEAIEKATRSITDGFPFGAFKNRSEIAHDDDLIEPLIAHFANRAVRYILFDSSISVDQALSNNLRHGVLIPRVLRAFDDALQLFERSRQHLPEWESGALNRFFDQDSVNLIKFREFVNEILKVFLAEHLTVKPVGSLEASLRAKIALGLQAAAIRAGENPEVLLANEISKDTEIVVKDFLGQASKYLDNHIRNDVFEELKKVRKVVKKGSPAASFLDSLDANLRQAFFDIVHWVGVSDSVAENTPFSFEDLVKLELVTTYLSSWRNLNVKTSVLKPSTERYVDERFFIQGHHFDLFQDVIHNLITNSFKHSGLRFRTRVHLEFISRDDEISIRCTNNISPSKVQDVISRYPDTVEKAAVSVKSQVSGGRNDLVDAKARKDSLSGFLKIKVAFLRSLDRDVSINILPVSRLDKIFSIEVSLSDPPEIWYVG